MAQRAEINLLPAAVSVQCFSNALVGDERSQVDAGFGAPKMVAERRFSFAALSRSL